MQRNSSIDILRTASAFAVIVFHIVSMPIVNEAQGLSAEAAQVLKILRSLTHGSVLIFFMITGFCLLSRTDCSYEYCFRHVRKYLCALFTVGLFYGLLEQVYVQRTIHAGVLLTSLENVVSGALWDHLWYVYAIIGIYLVLPVIHTFMNSSPKNARILTGLLFLFTIFLPSMKEYLSVGIDFPFGGYLFYVCFGGLLGKCQVKKPVLFFTAGTALASVLVLVLKAQGPLPGYKNLAICCLAMSVFVLVSRMNIKPKAFLSTVARCTWGIYLLHPLFINLAVKLFKLDLLSGMVYGKLAAFAVVIALVSFAATWILRKIPGVRYVF